MKQQFKKILFSSNQNPKSVYSRKSVYSVYAVDGHFSIV